MKIYSINKYLFSYNLFLFFLLNYNLFSQAILPTFYGIQAKNNYSLDCVDPRVSGNEVFKEYGIKIKQPKGKYDCIIVAVSHKEFIKMKSKKILELLNKNAFIIDIKGIWNRKISSKYQNYWCL